MKFSALGIWTNYLKSNWKVYFFGLLTIVVCDFMQVLASLNIGWILDFFNDKPIPESLVSTHKMATFYNLFFVLVGSRVILSLGRMGWRLTLARQTHYAGSYLRQSVWDHARFFSLDDINETFSKGHLMNVSNSDVTSAKFMFGFTLIGIFDVVFLSIITVTTMLNINVKMTCYALVSLFYLPYLIKKISVSEGVLYKKSQEMLSKLNDLASQVIASVKLQRLEQTGKFWVSKLTEASENYRQNRLNALNRSLLYIPVFSLTTVLGYIILFGLGINMLFNKEMTVGEFITMQGLIFLLQDPFEVLGWTISEWKKGMTGLERLAEVFNNKKEEYLISHQQNFDFKPDYSFDLRGLSFTYPGSNEKVFEGFDFKVESGGRVGVIGKIGTGKTTLVNILSGIERNFSGELLMGGKRFDEYSHAYLRSIMAHVHQKPFLFASSIKENVAMDKDLDDEQVWKYLSLAGLREDVESFPDKLETELGEWGINLSGGQKQRLTLARALAREPKILLLDDCLSAVDTVTEDKILTYLNEGLVDTTIVWVAHRRSTLKHCSTVIELGEGADV